jgi:hypothetical protein
MFDVVVQRLTFEFLHCVVWTGLVLGYYRMQGGDSRLINDSSIDANRCQDVAVSSRDDRRGRGTEWTGAVAVAGFSTDGAFGDDSAFCRRVSGVLIRVKVF